MLNFDLKWMGARPQPPRLSDAPTGLPAADTTTAGRTSGAVQDAAAATAAPVEPVEPSGTVEPSRAVEPSRVAEPSQTAEASAPRGSGASDTARAADDTRLAMAAPAIRSSDPTTVESTQSPPATTRPRVALDCRDLDAGVDLRFASGARGLDDDDRALLQAIARCASRAGLTLEVGGHTDSQGDSVGNLLLSVQRAELVASQLDRFGVPAAQLRPRGYGESQPRADNFTVTGRALNRRVTIRRVPG